MEPELEIAWYLDVTPNEMFSDLVEYPVAGKGGIPLCREHGAKLENKEAVVYDPDATRQSPPDYCWVCKE